MRRHFAILFYIYSLGSRQAGIFLACFIFMQLISTYLQTFNVVTYWIIARGRGFGIIHFLGNI